MLYLSGGNDALSTLVPTRDAVYYRRRPTLAVPAGSVLQIGTDSPGSSSGLHPRLTGLQVDVRPGPLAIIQRTGYENSSRSHFQGIDIWGTANPTNSQGTGWLGRYLDTLPSPVDPLVGWNTTRDTPRSCWRAGWRAGDHEPGDLQLLESQQRQRGVARTRPRRSRSRRTCRSIGRNSRSSTRTAQAAMGTLDRVAQVAGYQTTGLSRTTVWRRRCARWPARWNKRIGTKVFWVQTGGFDTHSTQGANAGVVRQPDGDA